jgi:nucleotide-binding universal stress UspA family protein
VGSLLPADQVTLLVRSGHAAQRIVAETEAGGHWLAVVGDRRHHSLWTRYLLGPVSQQVIEHAACPVVVAKGPVGSVRRVLICDSGYPERPLIPRVLQQLAPLLASVAAITVLHVMSQMAAGPGVESHDLDAAAAELVEEHAPEGELLSHDLALLAAAGYQAAVKVRHGLVVDEVLAEAHEGAHDLVIVGAHPGAGWRRILLDDVARRIVAGLDRPVAVVR